MHLKGVTGLIPTEAFCCIVVVPLLDCMIQIVVIVPVLAELLFTVFLTLFSTLHLFRLVLQTINPGDGRYVKKTSRKYNFPLIKNNLRHNFYFLPVRVSNILKF